MSQHNFRDNTAIFAAGCFWGVQAVFDNVRGVTHTVVGYTGGNTASPTYEEVCSGSTGHAEAILIEFNPDMVTYKVLLDILFSNHNPTTPNQQGPDIGSQYRSSIFVVNAQQRETATNTILELSHNQSFQSPIVTTIEIAGTFYPAESYHQQYYKKHNIQCRSNEQG